MKPKHWGKKENDMFTTCLYNAVGMGMPVLAATLIGNAPMSESSFSTLSPLMSSLTSLSDGGGITGRMQEAFKSGDESVFQSAKAELAQIVRGFQPEDLKRIARNIVSLESTPKDVAEIIAHPPITAGRTVVIDDDNFWLEESKKAIIKAGGEAVGMFNGLYGVSGIEEAFKRYEIDLTSVHVMFIDLVMSPDGLSTTEEVRSWGVSCNIYIASSHFGGEPSPVINLVKRIDPTRDVPVGLLGIWKVFQYDTNTLRKFLGLG